MKIKLKKPHETRSLLKTSISNIQLDKTVFGLSSLKEIDRTYKNLCEERASQNSAFINKALLKQLNTFGNARSNK